MTIWMFCARCMCRTVWEVIEDTAHCTGCKVEEILLSALQQEKR